MKKPISRLAARLPRGAKLALYRASTGAIGVGFTLIRPYFLLMRALRRRRLRALAERRQPVVVFLAPDAGVTPFYSSHAILARTIQEQGHGAIFLSCNGLLPACTVKFALAMGPTAPGDTSNAACRICRRNALTIGHRYDLLDESVETLVEPAEQETIAALIARHRPALQDLTYDGIAFGAVAIGDALRISRRTDVIEFTAVEDELAGALLYSALVVHFAFKKLEERYRVARIVFFGDYAYWIAAQAYAEKRGIAVTHVDHGYNMDVDRRLIELRPGSVNAHIRTQVARWGQYRNNPISSRAISLIAESGLYRLRGHGGVSTHSPNWVPRERGIQEELGLRTDRKTIVAYSSSLDEFVAVSRIMRALGKPYGQAARPFTDQHEWLRALVDWTATRSDLQLIVRLHPRLGASQRLGAQASEYSRFKQAFSECPPNVAMVWPEDSVSSYNLAEIADVAVVAWSTIGLELARFGIPVVTAFPDLGPYPVGGFIGFAADPAGYFATIESALMQAASLEHIIEAFRWTHYIHWSATIDVSDLVPARDYAKVPAWRLPAKHALIYNTLVRNEDVSTLTMATLERDQASVAAERQAMLKTVDHFVDFFIGSEELASSERRLRPQNDGTGILDGRGKSVRRYSPLVHRLLLMTKDTTSVALPPVA